MEVLLKTLEGSNIGIALIGFFVFIGYIRIYFTTNIQLLFMDKKEENKRFFARFLVLCSLLAIINFFLSFNVTSAMITSVLLGLSVIGRPIVCIGIKIFDWGREKILFSLKKKGTICNNSRSNTLWEEIRVYFGIIPILCMGPLVSYLITSTYEYNAILVVLITSVAETFLIFVRADGFASEESKILINKRDGSKPLFVYEKINDKYLLCGDAPKMENANEIITMEIEVLYSEEYFMKMKNV